jgi:cyclic pyranopterin phosphate synthase
MLEAYPSRDEILFTSGEPTLNDRLPVYVGWARDLGFGCIALITNGRRLAYRDYVEALVTAGLSRVTISIHGHDAKLHDASTRTPGSFAQSWAGLENACGAKRAGALEVFTSTVVTRRNLAHLSAIYERLALLPIDRLILNVMMARGRGATHLLALMPRYSEVVGAVGRLCEGLTSGEMARLWVADVPPCVARQLPGAVRGDLERYEQFEHLGSTGLSEISAFAAESPAAGAASRPDLHADADYYLTNRALKEGFGRIKGPKCDACHVNPQCQGVWQPYVAAFGWDELVPIEADARARAR